MPHITLSPTPLSRSPRAAVYRGWDQIHRCDVFVKAQRATADPIAMDRFRREAAVMEQLRHPNIVTLYRFYDGDPAALVMEYVPGPTLAALVGADGWLNLNRAAGIVEDIAAALDCAHAEGIIHRDVKPSNILLPKRGPARLTDFGVAHINHDAPLTVMGDVLGTIEYASPEQVHGNETPDARSDVYSLAAVAYFALTGTPPFRAADNSAQAQLSVMHRQVFADPPPLRFHREEIPVAVEKAVLRGLSKAPEARYQSAGQLAAALRVAVEAEGGTPEKQAMDASSRRTGALAGALTGVAALTLVALGLWHGKIFPPSSSVRRETKPMRNPMPLPLAPAFKPIPSLGSPRAPHPSLPLRVASKPQSEAPPVFITPTNMDAKKSDAKKSDAKKSDAKKSAALPMQASPKKSLAALEHPIRSRNAPKKVKPTVPGQGWIYVYANQNVSPLGHTPRVASIRPEAVYVDGRPMPDLVAGRWAALPSGAHTLSFFPDARSGYSPHTGISFTLKPGARIARQVLLPAMTNFTPRPASPPASNPVLEASPVAPSSSAPPHLRNP